MNLWISRWLSNTNPSAREILQKICRELAPWTKSTRELHRPYQQIIHKHLRLLEAGDGKQKVHSNSAFVNKTAAHRETRRYHQANWQPQDRAHSQASFFLSYQQAGAASTLFFDSFHGTHLPNCSQDIQWKEPVYFDKKGWRVSDHEALHVPNEQQGNAGGGP